MKGLAVSANWSRHRWKLPSAAVQLSSLEQERSLAYFAGLAMIRALAMRRPICLQQPISESLTRRRS
jgi:hypothetical protein